MGCAVCIAIKVSVHLPPPSPGFWAALSLGLMSRGGEVCRLGGGKMASFAGVQSQWLAGGPWDIAFSLWASTSHLNRERVVGLLAFSSEVLEYPAS